MSIDLSTLQEEFLSALEKCTTAEAVKELEGEYL